MAGFCEHGNEPSGFMKCGKYAEEVAVSQESCVETVSALASRLYVDKVRCIDTPAVIVWSSVTLQ